ncbi:hypothetical protein QQ020_35930 [Fulvivirgaceae bacterium BMA12]|uniref:Lipoprotein n=1 Tax=Agaribacillus aureus TaxID=3051825 RepID=A0ABT8LMG1_9BACT|nr:hypothetical protein [Fulvivirgaceae bacterium BMA12]
MKNTIIVTILSIFVSCSSKDANKQCIPKLIIETNKDTLNIDEVYVASIYLSSDSSLYYFKEYDGYVLPIVKVNGNEIQVNKKYVATYSLKLDEEYDLADGYNPRFFDCDFTFATNEGEITLSRRVSYWVLK